MNDKEMLTYYLERSATWIKKGEFAFAMINLKHAMRHANKLKHRKMKSLIFRAMNHIRTINSITQ